jgi:hypothetical protein
MNSTLRQVRNETREYAAGKRPKFYSDLGPELAYSKQLFFDHPLLHRCREDVLPFLNDEFGHGIEHCKHVAVDAGTIVLGELYPKDFALGRHLVLLVQIAALLHDICRLEEDHALEGSRLAYKILKDFPLSDADKDAVSLAIRNHEAFKPVAEPSEPGTALVSNALYDADKFRWGPDNFVTTLWEICDYEEWSLEMILRQFPRGLEIVRAVADTFRSRIGRIYGPEFIETGLELGNFIYRRLQQHCYADD